MFSKVWTTNSEFKNRQKTFQNQKETARSKVRQARRDKTDSKKDKERSRSKNPKQGCHSSILLQLSCDPVAIVVIFGVDVVPLSILPS